MTYRTRSYQDRVSECPEMADLLSCLLGLFQGVQNPFLLSGEVCILVIQVSVEIDCAPAEGKGLKPRAHVTFFGKRKENFAKGKEQFCKFGG